MYLKSVSVLLITALLNACSLYAGPIPEKAWSVSVSMSSFYPVKGKRVINP
ncbi:nitroreductase, partial [Vibrio anguillarum]|nr:nitroreductase [Vibrio anguillarum]MBF4375409.1 nitroreductase [Vibrio anguillarum]